MSGGRKKCPGNPEKHIGDQETDTDIAEEVISHDYSGQSGQKGKQQCTRKKWSCMEAGTAPGKQASQKRTGSRSCMSGRE